MLKLTAILLTTLIFGSALASDTAIRCNIESPCGWAEPAPGEDKARISYCVGSLMGDANELTLTLVDREGLIFEEIKMAATLAADGTITASDVNHRFSLYASVLDDGPVGTLDENVENIGYFTTCERSSSL